MSQPFLGCGQKAQPAKPVGVLMARVSLNGLSSMLGMEFPSTGRSAAAVVERLLRLVDDRRSGGPPP